MKPSFALDFRDGVIALLHRTTRGWQEVGASPLDAADLADALGYLRATALGLSPRGLSTKLVIPNDLILYTTVHAPGPEVAKRRKQIKAALEGLTPYKVDDLVFDWWGTGPEVQVAVVARETLVEAEAFAVEHRFNPVSFVGAPENGSYRGEPFFGPSALSTTLLAEGEKVERDQDPVSLLARDLPKAAPEEPVAAPAAEATSAPEAAPAQPSPAVSETAAEPAVSVSEPTPATVAAPAAPAIEPEPPAASQPQPEPTLPDFSGAKQPAASTSTFDPAQMAVDLVDEAPMALDVAEDVAVPVALPPSPPVTARPVEPPVKAAPPPPPPTPKPEPTVIADDVPPSPASAVIAAFATRRAATLAPAAETDRTRKSPTLGPAPLQRPSVQRPTLANPPVTPPVTGRTALPFPTKSTPAPVGKFTPGKVAKPVTTTAPAGLQAQRNVVQLPKQAAPGEAGTDNPAVTTVAQPGAKQATGLDGRPVATRGKPRYLGLILTGLLLLALALVAAWSSYFLTSNEDAVPATTGVAAADPTAAAPTPATPTPDTASTTDTTVLADAAPADTTDAVPSAAEEALADGQDPATAETTVTADLPAAAQTAATQTAAAEATPAKPDPAPGTLITTEAAQTSAQADDPQDEIFLADADTPPQTSDPLVLPQLVASSDPPPEAAAAPPPFGTLYTFDANGLIKPTPEGIITPEGVLLVAGAPKIVPPTRPAAPAVTPPDAAAASTADTALPAPGEPFPSDPALADKRPKPRPAALVDPAAATAKQGEALAPDANSRFASLRPRSRPATVTADAELTNDAAAASLAVNGVQPSTLAVATSKMPAARPSGMDQAVNAAVAAAVSAPEPDQQVASAAPEAQAEPEVEAAAPSLPTNASVAKQATTKDAINLSRVALLGIFGTASGRYAMIRQPAGGIKKVVVGDSIDGGRIAAITDKAVQYQKGGRMLTLSLPTG